MLIIRPVATSGARWERREQPGTKRMKWRLTRRGAGGTFRRRRKRRPAPPSSPCRELRDDSDDDRAHQEQDARRIEAAVVFARAALRHLAPHEKRVGEAE